MIWIKLEDIRFQLKKILFLNHFFMESVVCFTKKLVLYPTANLYKKRF
jgi:hypothetical protein